jgi:hypothetical protein
VLKSYYDRSGQETDSFMTLAGVAASDDVWAEIETKWWEILNNRSPHPSYLHMVEAAGLRDEFSLKKGWDKAKVDTLLSDLMVYLTTIDKERYCQFSVTINMEHYRNLRAKTYQMDSAVDLCIQGCVNRIMAWYFFKYQGTDIEASYFFDRNEPFEPVFHAKWKEETNRDGLTDGHSIWSHISDVGSACKEKVPGIQIADMLAWGSNRQICGYETFAHIATAMHVFIGTHSLLWDEAKLRERFRPLLWV